MRHAFASFSSIDRRVFSVVAIVLVAVALALGTLQPAAANPRYAAFVMDARTGQVLFSRNGDAQRYPASLTKMMTAYMLFEALESGKVSKSTRIPISAKAAAEPPTKIGLRAGASITVDNAIKALVTRSANDIATAAGEFLGGSEATFARMMTEKARQLGMNSTQFRNAHGLPNNQQFTTARDMAILGIALREHFPQHYSYFSTRSFTLGKQTFNNHNRLLSRVRGTDGIKTGFIRASGFNLVSSVQDNGRSIVAVVMGGQSARSRDDHMANLIGEHLPRASTKSSGPLLAGRRPLTSSGGAAVAFALPSRDIPVPNSRPEGDFQAAAYVAQAFAGSTPNSPVPPAAIPNMEPQQASIPAQGSATVDPVNTASTSRSGWVVQVASAPSESEANNFLARTSERASDLLRSAAPFTEVFQNKGVTYFRARFGGFSSKTEAWNTCEALKKRKIDCYAVEL